MTINETTYMATLLPGTYTSTSPALTSNTSAAYFNRGMIITPSIGFASAGSESSSINVALLAGVTTYSNTLYQGAATYSPLLSINSTAGANSPSPATGSVSSLLVSPNTFVILTSASSSHLVIYNSLPDISQLPSNVIGSSGGVGVAVGVVQSSTCVGGCSTGGVCGVEGKCVCKSGFVGASCSESFSSLSRPFFKPIADLIHRHRLVSSWALR